MVARADTAPMIAPLSAHATARLRQRGVPSRVLDLLLHYGDVAHDHHGAEIIHFGPRCRRAVERDLGPDGVRLIERHPRVYAVVAGDGYVKTVGHRTRRLRR